MREMCESLHEGNSLLEVREGTAEETGLAHASVDIVSAGRATHWFHLERSMADFRRILKPEGWVAIIAFGTTEQKHEENEALEKVLCDYSEDHADTHEGYDVYRNLAKQIPRYVNHEKLLSSIALDWEGLHGIVMSLSASPLGRFAAS
jgi:ubiquinone/menaquinone biosynthesis C-methylase UbiE